MPRRKMILFFPPPSAAETRKGLRPLPGPCPGRWDGGRGPGGVPASVEGACCPARRGAALPAGGPLRRRDGRRGDGRMRFAARLGTRDERRGTGADAPPRAWERGTRDGGIGSAPAHRAGAVFIFFGPGSGRFGRGSGGRARRRQLPGSAPPAESAGAG